MAIEWIGFVGMAILNMCYAPQIVKTLRTKSVKDISPYHYMISFTGLVFYLIYAITTKDLVYIISNIVSLGFIATILMLMGIYGGEKK